MTPEEEALARRRRAKNYAMLGVLVGLVVLFYFISMARMTRGG